MTTLSSVLTYDQANPHRVTLAELGGGAFQDDPRFPPDPTEHPSAGMFNQATKQVVALAGMAPSLKIQVEFSAGTPVITQLVSLGTKVTVANFVVVDNADGDTTLLLSPSLIPPQLTRPSGLTIVEDVDIDCARIIVVAGGWRIKTKIVGAGADAAFTFQVN